jgi:hypothetical protein
MMGGPGHEACEAGRQRDDVNNDDFEILRPICRKNHRERASIELALVSGLTASEERNG